MICWLIIIENGRMLKWNLLIFWIIHVYDKIVLLSSIGSAYKYYEVDIGKI